MRWEGRDDEGNVSNFDRAAYIYSARGRAQSAYIDLALHRGCNVHSERSARVPIHKLPAGPIEPSQLGESV